MNRKKGKVPKTVLMLCAVAGWMMLASVQAADYPDAGNAGKGAQVWAENCSRCHNARDPKDLRDDQWITSVFHMRVRAGLTGQQSRDVLTFLQESNEVARSASMALTTPRADESGMESTASGADIYAGTCIACHGSSGKGTVPGAPDFNSSRGPLSQSDEVLFDHIKNGFQSPGSPMAMPPKGGNASLNDADLRAIVEYLRSRFGG